MWASVTIFVKTGSEGLMGTSLLSTSNISISRDYTTNLLTSRDLMSKCGDDGA